MSRGGNFWFDGDLESVDPLLKQLIDLEEERQIRRLILIPSESVCHPAVRRALDSVFTNLYAEGYPSSMTTFLSETELADFPAQLGIYRRYADRRFYKGTDYVNIVEALCKRRAAVAFANERVSSNQIFANVQALSGAAANLAVMEAFLKPGDTILSMDLMHGGHLSHGSQFHMSGRRYKVVSYGIHPRTGQIDYDEIEKLAHAHRPKMLVGGFSSYPFAPDWTRLNAIARQTGALLLADIAHPAGMVAAGAYPSPIGLADVVTFTTHKTLMGPRGAVILTTEEEKAAMIDQAVFPGEQGGPHLNNIAALAVALHIATTPEFKALQHKIVENARSLADALKAEGLELAYGGTDTHLLLVDLKKLPKSPTGEVLRGEPAVRLLELCGIVCNKNTIPGDDLTALATGIRMGTPWLTQRGIKPEQITKLAKVISRVLRAIVPFHYDGLTGTLPRGKIDFATLQSAKEEVASLAEKLDGRAPIRSAYPHYHFTEPLIVSGFGNQNAEEASKKTAALFKRPGGMLRVTGARAEHFIQNLVTADLTSLAPKAAVRTLMANGDGQLIDDVVIVRIASRTDTRENGFYIIPNPERSHSVLAWLRGHADGYLLFDPEDVTAKVEGPAFVEDMETDKPDDERLVVFELTGEAAEKIAKTGADTCPEAWSVYLREEKTAWVVLPYLKMGDVEALLFQEGAVPCVLPSRLPLRRANRLPDYPAHIKDLAKTDAARWFAIHKPYFVGQRLVKEFFAPPTDRETFEWKEMESPIKRTTLYDEHRKISKKIIPFAGWEMPVWYTSTLEEHKATRTGCALYDVSHMGVFEISGPNATDFLDLVATNYARWVKDGESYYAYLPDPDGRLIDDIMVYRLGANRYLVVVNASNEEKDWTWMNQVNSGKALIDREIPQRRVLAPATIRNLKDRRWGEECRVDIALQGPRSRDVLAKLLSPADATRLRQLRRTGCGEFTLSGLPVVLSRTGYTGEQMGFEIFVHPDKAPELWRKLVETGKPMGLIPAGLGARDSTRTEAGLPLYGHELEGAHGISPMGAGFPSYVKFHKPFFIGRKALLEQERKRDRVIVRFVVPEKGTKPLKPGDPVATPRGDHIGVVTSCAVDGEGRQVGLAYVLTKSSKLGPVAIFPMPPEDRRDEIVPPTRLAEKTKTLLPVAAEIVSRFPPKPLPLDLVRTEAQVAMESID